MSSHVSLCDVMHALKTLNLQRYNYNSVKLNDANHTDTGHFQCTQLKSFAIFSLLLALSHLSCMSRGGDTWVHVRTVVDALTTCKCRRTTQCVSD